MAWPTWIDTLRDRYLANEASVFLLHGAVEGSTWEVDGAELDCAGVLGRFLERSREILGFYTPGEALRFASVTDHSAFHRMVEARQALDGRPARLAGRTPEEALGLLWLALTTPGKRQGYVLSRVDQLAPARRKKLPELAASAPALPEWPLHPQLRASDNVVVLLARDPLAVRADLLAACSLIEVAAPAPKVVAPPPAPPAEDPAAAAEAELEALGQTPTPRPPATPPPLPPPAPPTPDAAATELSARLNTALRAAILRHPSGEWAGNLPGREALAEVLYALEPGRFGALSFAVAEGQARAVGEGAAAFEAWYSGDIAVDAACGMALNDLEPPPGGFTEANLPELNPAALRAMARRVERLLKSGA